MTVVTYRHTYVEGVTSLCRSCDRDEHVQSQLPTLGSVQSAARSGDCDGCASRMTASPPIVAALWLPGDRVDGSGLVAAVDGARVKVEWDSGGETWHPADELFPEVRS